MMDQFLYVFEPAARDELLQAGFLMLKEDEQGGMWVFLNDAALKFDFGRADFSYTTSSTLTF